MLLTFFLDAFRMYDIDSMSKISKDNLCHVNILFNIYGNYLFIFHETTLCQEAFMFFMFYFQTISDNAYIYTYETLLLLRRGHVLIESCLILI